MQAVKPHTSGEKTIVLCVIPSYVRSGLIIHFKIAQTVMVPYMHTDSETLSVWCKVR